MTVSGFEGFYSRNAQTSTRTKIGEEPRRRQEGSVVMDAP
ncbi:MAG: hypothetical protein AVDCRST_MAG91-2844 [uncultured Sphingomonadaceae bacterium]|uniref:Uncharacterized protein n=1 Tax=uncultured Sphingomonadaceae bacterium TaxID=169976 RepID=A0A6J4TQS8_9SPHN|nr:MAG: hypothetical protein AVDCRST_MAG91-2844 [uncultured Sphingomonadaceae bacterium]